MDNEQSPLRIGDLSERELAACYRLAWGEYSVLLSKHSEEAVLLLKLIETIERVLQDKISISSLRGQG